MATYQQAAGITNSFERQARGIARLTGLGVSIHTYANTLRRALGAAHWLHTSPVCLAVKDHPAGGAQRCMSVDMRPTQSRLADARRPFLKICYAGVAEVVYPIQQGRTLTGALFLGPFVFTGEPPSDSMVDARRPPESKGIAHLCRALRRVDALGLEDVLTVGALLVSRLEGRLDGDDEPSVRDGGRSAQIARFLTDRLAEPVSLGILARRLCLSSSRTSQLIRLHFGTTFPRLLAQVRLRHAMQLLEHTEFSISEIARCVGIPAQSQFQRLFRRATGKTPGEYRKVNRPGRQEGDKA